MSVMSNMAYEIQEDLEEGVLTHSEIATKFNMTTEDITVFAREFMEQMADLG